MKNMLCTICGKPRTIGRRQCLSCYKEEARKRSNLRAKKGIRTRYTKNCAVCGDPYTTTHKKSVLCLKCFTDSRKKHKKYLVYKFISKNIREHREIAERYLNRKLSPKEHVHHLDGDTLNNSLKNLIVIANTYHGKLHRYMDIELAILDKRSDMDEESLKIARKNIVLSFLYQESIPVIKLWEYKAPMGELVDPKE